MCTSYSAYASQEPAAIRGLDCNRWSAVRTKYGVICYKASGLYIGQAEQPKRREGEIKLHPFMAWLIWEFKKTSSEAEGGGLYFQRVEMALASSLWYSGKSWNVKSRVKNQNIPCFKLIVWGNLRDLPFPIRVNSVAIFKYRYTCSELWSH